MVNLLMVELAGAMYNRSPYFQQSTDEMNALMKANPELKKELLRLFEKYKTDSLFKVLVASNEFEQKFTKPFWEIHTKYYDLFVENLFGEK